MSNDPATNPDTSVAARSLDSHDAVASTRRPSAGAPDPSAVERIAVGVAVKAADLVRRRLGSPQTVRTKSTPTDVVTAADVDVETLIRRELEAATPGAAILGEEGAPVSGHTSIGWIIDPIDGTVNFLYDLPVMSVSIGATLDGNVVAGAVVDVVRGDVFHGSAGNGVRRDGDLVSPSATTDLADALVATGFSYAAEVRRREGAVVARVLPAVRDIRCFGSAALHLCWVACGRLEAFYQEGLQEWDVAAGAFLASEAGAKVELGSGANGRLVLAATPGVFAPLRTLIRG